MDTKRINLSFDINREDDLKVYNILSEQKYKTDYVIRAVLRFLEKENQLITKKEIKEAVKEALEEYGGISDTNKNEEKLEDTEYKLPDKIFDMFNSL